MAIKTNLKGRLVIAAILLGFGCGIASGGIIYVDANAPPGGNGQTWGTAYKYLQDALDDANSAPKPVEIWVAEGTYKPDANTANPAGTGERNATFQLINGLTIKGGYAGYLAPDPNARNINLYETILSGDLDGNDTPGLDPCDLFDYLNRGENSYHVVTGSVTNETAILDGFTITAGNANGSDPDDAGGGMYNESGSPTVTNCTFSGNSADNGGGMFNFDHSSPTLTNCIFSGNSADYGGGMLNINISSPTLTNCTFSGNSADNGGGGLFNFNASSARVTNCILWGNTAGLAGNEIVLAFYSTIDVNYSDIKDGNDGIYKDGTSTINWGIGNIDADPCFVDAHLEQTQDYITLDDFEDYINDADLTDNGWEVVKSCLPALATEDEEWWIQPRGLKSMEYKGTSFLDPYYSEVQSKFVLDPNNWTSAKVLSLWFYGLSYLEGIGDTNPCTETERWWVELEDIDNDKGRVWYPVADKNDFRADEWLYWDIPLKDFNDNEPLLDLNKPLKLHLGFGTGTQGVAQWTVVYFDSIGLLDSTWMEDDNLRLSHNSPCIDAGDNNSVPADTTDLDNDGNTVEPIPFDIDGDPRFMDGDCNDTVIVDMGAYEFIPGDIDGDGDVDGGDFATFASYWMKTGCGLCGGADLTGDGNVDWDDVAELVKNWLVGAQ